MIDGRTKWHLRASNPGMQKPIVLEIDAHTKSDAERQAIEHLLNSGLSRYISEWDEAAAAFEILELTPGQGLGLPLVDVAAWVNDPPPRRSLWGDWLPVHQTTMLSGEGGVGKSLFEQCLCTAIAVGKPFLGMKTEQRNTLYVTCEDDPDELFRRQAAIERALDIERKDWLGRLHLSSLIDAEGSTSLAAVSEGGELVPTDRWRDLTDTCKGLNIGLYAFDNATDAFDGDHNDASQVAAFVSLMTRLAGRQDGAAMILHHPNKSGDDWLGSVAWHNKVRSRLWMEFGDVEVDPDARRILNPKSNYGPAGQRIDFRWHEGAFVRAEELPAETGKQLARALKEKGAQEAFLACLRARGPGREVGPHFGPNYAPARFAEMKEAKGFSKAKLATAMEALLHIGAVETAEVKRRGRETKTVLVEVEG